MCHEATHKGDWLGLPALKAPLIVVAARPSSRDASNHSRARRRGVATWKSDRAGAGGPRFPQRSVQEPVDRTGRRSRRSSSQRAPLVLTEEVDALTREAELTVLGTRMPARQCRSVDLPEPLGPMTARISPSRIDRFAPRRAGVSPKSNTTSRASNEVGPGVQHQREAVVTSQRPPPWRAVEDARRSCRSSEGRPQGGTARDRRARASIEIVLAFHLGQLAHSPQMRRALGVEVLFG